MEENEENYFSSNYFDLQKIKENQQIIYGKKNHTKFSLSFLKIKITFNLNKKI